MGRIEEEKQTVRAMISLYCKRQEGNTKLCSQCQELLDYAEARLTRCRFGEAKPTCKQCPVHCYRPEMRERMCQVMHFAGPRMPLYHPVMAVRHLIRELWQ